MTRGIYHFIVLYLALLIEQRQAGTGVCLGYAMGVLWYDEAIAPARERALRRRDGNRRP